MTIAGAILSTAGVFIILAVLFSVWILDESRGADWRSWHRGTAALLFAVGAALTIAAAWTSVIW